MNKPWLTFVPAVAVKRGELALLGIIGVKGTQVVFIYIHSKIIGVTFYKMYLIIILEFRGGWS